jgi:hypothetical protein
MFAPASRYGIACEKVSLFEDELPAMTALLSALRGAA